jgi:5-methylcytosine-specific restriction enzyme B
MARFCGEKETESKFKAAQIWKKKCLLALNSVFSDAAIWTKDNIEALNEYFVNNLDYGEGDFFEKLEAQIEPTNPYVKKLAAEMMWFMLLCPSNIGPEKKRESVSRIWSWSGDSLPRNDELLGDQVLTGIGSAGTSFNTNRWRELVYFIQFARSFCDLPMAKREQLLSDGWLLSEWLEQIPENDARQLRHMVLFLLFPDHFDRIFGGTDRRKVVQAFTDRSKAEVGKLSALELDKALAEIRQTQEQDFGTDQLDFYVPPLKEQWGDKEHKHWLFSWNPNNWEWDDLPEFVSKTASGKSVITSWSCSNGQAAVGDKAWLVRLGAPPKGIMATGNIVKAPYDNTHWDQAKAATGETCKFVDIEFTKVVDIYKDKFLTLDDLSAITIDKQSWTPQSSGIEVKKRSAGLLEKLWDQVTTGPKVPPLQPLKTIKDPVNVILYGPPGTGKTYALNRLVEKYTTKSSSVSREQWLSKELESVKWSDVVFMALYALGGKAKVAEIEQHEFVQQKAKAIGRTKHIKQQIWASLQTHTVESSTTVKYAKRQAPLIFDKSTTSVWSLVEDWRDTCEDQIVLADTLKESAPKNAEQKRYEFVTFHQAYSYEDFVEGIRPIQDEESGELVYRVVPGVFRRICQRAKNDPGNRYALFVDEINRGNIAKIFGELITLVEIDKRAEYDSAGNMLNSGEGMALTLPYSPDEPPFAVPKNLDIHGTMNTADRSIALLDTALRRRFTFEELMPNSSVIAGSRGDGYIEDGEGGVINLRALLDAMNSRIRFLLNRDLMLGHAYLCKVKEFGDLKQVMLNQFIPLLQEYFYDDWERIQLVFRDIGQGGSEMPNQIVVSRKRTSIEVLGFEHEDQDDLIEYHITTPEALTPDSVRKIYEE